MRTATEGSRSEGFSTKAFPQAMDTGYIQSGTMAGKLNGVMPATTPTGWRTAKLSMPAATPSEYSPFRSCGIPQANSHHLDTARELALGVRKRLAVFGRQHCGKLVRVAVEKVAELEHDRSPLGRRRCAPGGLGPAGRRDRMSHIRCRRQSDPCGHGAGRRIEDVAGPHRSAGPECSRNEMLDGIHRSVLPER